MKRYYLFPIFVFFVASNSIYFAAFAQTTTSGGISEAPTTVPPGSVDPSLNERNGTIPTEIVKSNLTNNDNSNTMNITE